LDISVVVVLFDHIFHGRTEWEAQTLSDYEWFTRHTSDRRSFTYEFNAGRGEDLLSEVFESILCFWESTFHYNCLTRFYNGIKRSSYVAVSCPSSTTGTASHTPRNRFLFQKNFRTAPQLGVHQIRRGG
jgi:hypothetical protein